MHGLVVQEETGKTKCASVSILSSKVQNREVEKESATNPPPVLYENIDPLSQSSVQTAPSYENIPAVAFSQPQSGNIEMKECPAYGVVTRT